MVTVHQQGVELVAQMAQSYVTGLSLAHSKLGQTAMTQLAQGVWPQLQRLVLTGNQLDEAAITLLVNGKWPLLTSLVLDANSSLSPAAIALLPRAASWASLSQLSLAQMHLDSSCLHSVALLHTQLQNLSLAFTCISTTALSQLHTLVLTGDRLTPEAITGLVLAEIPHMADLYLGNNKLDATAAGHLSKSTWPKLRSLALASNAFDDTAMAFLAEGNWPKLVTLSLYGNEISVVGCELLMAGQWPSLCGLTLYNKNVASWTLFSLSNPLPDGKKQSSYFVASRNLSRGYSDRPVVCPKLRRVHFRPGWRYSKTQPCLAHVLDKQDVTTSVKPASISTGVRFEYPPQMAKSTQCLQDGHDILVRSVNVNKHQPTGKKRWFWQQLMDWSALVCLALHMWLFKRRRGQTRLMYTYVLDGTFYLCSSTDLVWTFRSARLNTAAAVLSPQPACVTISTVAFLACSTSHVCCSLYQFKCNEQNPASTTSWSLKYFPHDVKISSGNCALTYRCILGLHNS